MKVIKPRVIRPGQRVPYRKGTQAEIDQRRGFVARMLDIGANKMQIHRLVRDKFNIEWRQCDRYIAWLTRTHARGYCQIMTPEMLENLKIIFGDEAK
jgi:hypothetical protein